MKRTILTLALLVGACDNLGIPWPDLERMKDQGKHKAQKESTFFEDGRAMRTPPTGTVPRERDLEDPEFNTGLSGNEFLSDFPGNLVIDDALLNHGQGRFDIYCAPCHGVLGDGKSRIADRMSLRKAPSLHTPRYLDYPPGRIYYIVSKGFGLMASYSQELDPIDRWAVVAYVKALQMSQNTTIGLLPDTLRDEAQKAVSNP
jgi:mono/diheme cytochrome c family protein